MEQRHRSLTGCGGCRSRHLKCDEGRPGCLTCHLAGIACPGYNAQIKWPIDINKPRGPASERSKEHIFRRPLYQVVEQEAMTKATANSLGKTTTNAALDNIERWPESGSGPCLFQGPFGVLNFMHQHMFNKHAIDHAKSDGSKKENNSLAVSMNSVTELSGMEQTSTHHQFSEPTPLSPVVPTSEDSFQDIFNFDSPMSPVHPLTREPELSSMDILPRALEFLRHFKDNVRSFSLPLRGNSECPWQTIHLPAAMSTYAELLVIQKASHYRLSLLNSLVSASCLDRARRSRNTTDCKMLYIWSQRHAKQHLELALKEEITSRKPAKYKELLVAILSMVYLEVYSGEYKNAQRFLVEAESLIRRRGFSKARKSSKVRTLHHIYTWLRIFAESTCGCALVTVCPARPDSSLASDGELTQNLQSFRLPTAATLNELDMGVEKSDLVGYQDIHLEVMGLWNDSLFPIMYGIPESLMGLLSQAIRLANEQELFPRDTLVDVEVVTNLSQRSKKLEHHILCWELEPPPPNSHHSMDSDNNGNSDRTTPETFCYNAFAMHQGLILFYYRRVHNINALILQETVQKTLHFIEEACRSNQKESQNLSLLWPCFIAACEAVDKSIQVRLLDWLRDMFHRTAVGTFVTAADVAQRVWKAREESSDFTLSWFDVMEHDQWPIIIV